MISSISGVAAEPRHRHRTARRRPVSPISPTAWPSSGRPKVRRQHADRRSGRHRAGRGSLRRAPRASPRSPSTIPARPHGHPCRTWPNACLFLGSELAGFVSGAALARCTAAASRRSFLSVVSEREQRLRHRSPHRHSNELVRDRHDQRHLRRTRRHRHRIGPRARPRAHALEFARQGAKVVVNDYGVSARRRQPLERRWPIPSSRRSRRWAATRSPTPTTSPTGREPQNLDQDGGRFAFGRSSTRWSTTPASCVTGCSPTCPSRSGTRSSPACT